MTLSELRAIRKAIEHFMNRGDDDDHALRWDKGMRILQRLLVADNKRRKQKRRRDHEDG